MQKIRLLASLVWSSDMCGSKKPLLIFYSEYFCIHLILFSILSFFYLSRVKTSPHLRRLRVEIVVAIGVLVRAHVRQTEVPPGIIITVILIIRVNRSTRSTRSTLSSSGTLQVISIIVIITIRNPKQDIIKEETLRNPCLQDGNFRCALWECPSTDT